MSLRTIAALFARTDSVYKSLPGIEVYDAHRDARTFPGGMPVIAHPPCRAWGSLRWFAKPLPGERELAFFAVDQVRSCGGILEHPIRSVLWDAAGLPRPGQRDRWGGWTLPILQFWFGHRAEKATYLYIVGIEPADLPPIPFVLGESTHVIASKKRYSSGGRRPDVSKAEREHTPLELAKWLAKAARLSSVEQGVSLGAVRAGNALAGVSRDRDSIEKRPAPCLSGKDPAQVQGRALAGAKREARRTGVAGSV